MTVTANVDPVRLGPGRVLHLADDLTASYLAVDGSYWEHADRHAELADGRVLSIFDYTSTWGWWERHPIGDELALLLSGDVELLLEDQLGTRTTIRLAPGDSGIIPAAAWHTIRVASASRILFLTPTPARTQHRPA